MSTIDEDVGERDGSAGSDTQLMSFVVDQRTLRLLLIPQPLLSLAFVAAIRGHIVEPSFVPVLILAAFPLAAMGGAGVSLRERRASARGNWMVLAVGLVELCWAVLTLAIVGFAIALRSG